MHELLVEVLKRYSYLGAPSEANADASCYDTIVRRVPYIYRASNDEDAKLKLLLNANPVGGEDPLLDVDDDEVDPFMNIATEGYVQHHFSSNFRLVCKHWRAVHDAELSVAIPRRVPPRCKPPPSQQQNNYTGARAQAHTNLQKQ